MSDSDDAAAEGAEGAEGAEVSEVSGGERLDALRGELAQREAELAAEREALAADREALAAERRALTSDRHALAREWAELRAAQSASAASRSAQPSAERRGRPTPPGRPSVPGWVEQDGGAFVCRVGAATTRGEHELLRLNWPDGWLLASGVEVADRTRTREIDLLVVAPQGVVVIEQKDTAARGTLHFSVNGPPTLDGRPLPPLAGALRQARLPSQMLAANSREAGVRVGYVHSLLTVRGRVRVEPPQLGGVHLSAFTDTTQRVHALLGPHDDDAALPVGTVLALLSSLGLPLSGLPALQEIGFPDSSW